MSTYNKTTWVDNQEPGLSAANLNKIEAGIADAHSELDAHANRVDNPHGTTAAQVGAVASNGSIAMTGPLPLTLPLPAGINTADTPDKWPSAGIAHYSITPSTMQNQPTGYGKLLHVAHQGVRHQLYFEWIHPQGGASGSVFYRHAGENDTAWGQWHRMWHAGNHGSGSGLDADTVDGVHAGTGANNVLKLDGSGMVPLGNIPGTLTGKSADQLDTYHANTGTAANTIPVRDANGKVPGSITGDADTVDGAHAGTGASNVLKLDTSGLVPLENIPSALTGKSADQLDGFHANTGTTASTIPVRDASGKVPGSITGDADTVDGAHAGTGANNVLKLDGSALVPLANIPGTLTGKSADQLDGYHAGNASGNVPVSNGVLNSNLNADMVDGEHVDFYDSGWFAVTIKGTYVKAHGLGATPRIVKGYVSTDAVNILAEFMNSNYSGWQMGIMIRQVDSANIVVQCGEDRDAYIFKTSSEDASNPGGVIEYSSTMYARVFALK